MAETGDPLGSARIDIRANVKPLEADLKQGEQVAKQGAAKIEQVVKAAAKDEAAKVEHAAANAAGGVSAEGVGEKIKGAGHELSSLHRQLGHLFIPVALAAEFVHIVSLIDEATAAGAKFDHELQNIATGAMSQLASSAKIMAHSTKDDLESVTATVSKSLQELHDKLQGELDRRDNRSPGKHLLERVAEWKTEDQVRKEMQERLQEEETHIVELGEKAKARIRERARLEQREKDIEDSNREREARVQAERDRLHEVDRRNDIQQTQRDKLRDMEAKNREDELAGVAKINEERHNALVKQQADIDALGSYAEKSVTDAMVRALNKSFDLAIKRFELQMQQVFDQIGEAAAQWGTGDLTSSINNVADLLRIIANNGTPIS